MGDSTGAGLFDTNFPIRRLFAVTRFFVCVRRTMAAGKRKWRQMKMEERMLERKLSVEKDRGQIFGSEITF